MRSVNLLQLTAMDDPSLFERYEKQLSFRNEKLKVDMGEIQSIRKIMQHLNEEKCTIEDLAGYFYAFKIPQIGKEFDLLRIGDNTILNIEIKSFPTTEAKILEQLKKNQYYLQSLCREIIQFSYLLPDDRLYVLNQDGELQISSFSVLLKAISIQRNVFNGDISELFKVSDFLISPLNTPMKFYKGEYFLTNHQAEIKRKILQSLSGQSHKYYGLTGDPGTGKTILLYDLARELCKTKKVLIIHCGILSDGHHKLNELINNISIIPAKALNDDLDLSRYQYIMTDETHRMYWPQFENLVEKVNLISDLCVIFSYDINQTLSKNEIKSNIAERIGNLPLVSIFELSGKIRTNPEISSFIKRLLDLKSHDIKDSYPSVDINYTASEKQTIELLKYYKSRNYTYIRYSGSNYVTGLYDQVNLITTSDYDTHHVIGQEYDNVVMVIGQNFEYNEEKKLISRQHPNPDYLYRQLLFQGLTRTREKLAIIVWNNKPVFEAVLSIVQKEHTPIHEE
ncbi:MAG: DUF2075 domain-containing protein [Oscillospiraceae bacterium]|nr:DUF2075 domain-containing protein [Oscillospiraceae bacterium]